MDDHQPVFDGRNATIVAPNASTNVVVVPEAKVMLIKRFHVTNNNAVAARVRFWDSFTDSGGTLHDAVTNPVLLADIRALPNETIDLTSSAGLAKAIGTVIARSTQAAADPNDVTAGAWGTFEE